MIREPAVRYPECARCRVVSQIEPEAIAIESGHSNAWTIHRPGHGDWRGRLVGIGLRAAIATLKAEGVPIVYIRHGGRYTGRWERREIAS